MATYKKRKTNFKYGFDIMGKRTTQVGESLVGTYKAPESWEDEYPVYEGTPIQIDTDTDDELKIAPDGEDYHGLLFSRVSDELTDFEWIEGLVERDEVQAGDPVTYIIPKKKAIIETSLLHEDNTPSAGDDVYIEEGLFSNSDPTGDDSGEVIGEVLTVDDDDEYAEIILK